MATFCSQCGKKIGLLDFDLAKGLPEHDRKPGYHLCDSCGSTRTTFCPICGEEVRLLDLYLKRCPACIASKIESSKWYNMGALWTVEEGVPAGFGISVSVEPPALRVKNTQAMPPLFVSRADVQWIVPCQTLRTDGKPDDGVLVAIFRNRKGALADRIILRASTYAAPALGSDVFGLLFSALGKKDSLNGLRVIQSNSEAFPGGACVSLTPMPNGILIDSVMIGERTERHGSKKRSVSIEGRQQRLVSEADIVSFKATKLADKGSAGNDIGGAAGGALLGTLLVGGPLGALGGAALGAGSDTRAACFLLTLEFRQQQGPGVTQLVLSTGLELSKTKLPRLLKKPNLT